MREGAALPGAPETLLFFVHGVTNCGKHRCFVEPPTDAGVRPGDGPKAPGGAVGQSAHVPVLGVLSAGAHCRVRVRECGRGTIIPSFFIKGIVPGRREGHREVLL